MKTRTFLLALAATMMLFVGCGKDNDGDNGGGNGGGGNIPELTPNMLVVGEQQYQLQPTLSITNEGYYLFGAYDPNGLYDIIADVPSTLLNQTVDLAQLSDVDRFYINFSAPGLSFALQTGSQPISAINEEPVDAVFSQGTLQFTNENGVVTLRVSGTLTNGTYVGFMMSVAVTDIEAMDYQIILDGQAYSAEGLAIHWTDATLSYEMMLSTEEGQATVRVEVEPSAFTHHIDLTTTTAAIKYRVTINFWDQDSTATQSAFTGTVESSYWDIEEQANHPVDGCLFTRGSLYVNEDEYAIGFSLNGSLTNGRSVSAQIRFDKSEIEERSVR